VRIGEDSHGKAPPPEFPEGLGDEGVGLQDPDPQRLVIN
jgi:hypothetical protein